MLIVLDKTSPFLGLVSEINTVLALRTRVTSRREIHLNNATQRAIASWLPLLSQPPPKYYIFEANVDKYRAPFEIM